MMISQKDAVYQATMAVLEQNQLKLEDGQNIREVIKDNMQLRAQIRDLVFEGIKGHIVPYGGDDSNHNSSSMRSYATGLISNWFRKDSRLNGGNRYRPGVTQQTGSHNLYEDQIQKLKAAADVVYDDDLKERLLEAIHEVEEQAELESRIAGEVQSGRYKEDEGFDDEPDEESKPNETKPSNSKIVDQEAPPSMGSGHKGAVTDPESDRRLKRNETPELLQSRQEAGQKGGTSTRDERGTDFYSKIGQKGGLSRGSNEGQRVETVNEENPFLKILRKTS